MGRPAGRAAEAIAIDREMATLYRQGMTLAEIGLRFGITRERVRQRLALAGVSRLEGGEAVRVALRRAMKLDALRKTRDASAMRTYGCSYADLMMINGGLAKSAPGSACRAYIAQRCNAWARGIEWSITLPEWWKVWQDSGRWAERGRGQGYCMARHLDEGPYAAGNVYICTCGQNSSDGYLKTPWVKRFPHLVKKPGALSLSAFEQRVADLSSQGFGRRQIAKQLSRPVGAVNWAMWHAKKLTPAAV